MYPQFPTPAAKPTTKLSDLTSLLQEWEQAAAQSIDATLRDPATVKANGEAFSAFAAVCAALPEFRISTKVTQDLPEGGLGASYPAPLLAATRAGWATASAGLLTLALARGAEPMSTSMQMGALQTKLFQADEPKIAPTPRSLRWSKDSAQLWQFAPEQERSGEPIVIVASLVNRYYLLDLLDGQSLVQRLLEGTDRPLYLLDWIPAGDEDLDGVVDLLADALEHLGGASLLGYSMGGTVAAIAAARKPELVKALAVFGAPIDTSRGGRFTEWAEHADFGAVASAFSAVPAAWIHAPFWALRPTVNVHKLCQLVSRWEQDGYLDRFLAVELWNNDNVDLGSKLYGQWGEELYSNNSLWNGELADLGTIKCPTLAVAASHDGIVPPECTLALAEKTGGKAVTIKGGHVGSLSGRKGLSELSAALIEFFSAAAAEPAAKEEGR